MAVTEESLAELERLMVPPDKRFTTINAMLYGISGGGKSVLAQMIAQAITAPDKTILHLCTGDGWKSGKNHPGALDRLIPMEYVAMAQIEAIVDAVKASKTSSDPRLDRFRNIGAVILDELSTMTDMDLDTVTQSRSFDNMGKPVKNKDGTIKDPDSPDWPDRNTATNRGRKILYKLVSTPEVHVIAIAHERKDQDHRKVTITCPSFWQALRAKVKEPLDFVGRVEGNISEANGQPYYSRTVQCHPSKLVDAKTRIGGLDVFEDFDSLVSKMKVWLESGGQKVDESLPVVLPSELPREHLDDFEGESVD